MRENKGTLYWITGLSGAGKTTVGTLLFKEMRKNKNNVVILDGDSLREVFGNDLGYTEKDRRISAGRNSRISKMLTDQGIDVICCTISMYDDVREWNRASVENYVEVYLKVPDEVLKERNQKGLYETSQSELVGFGVKMQEPKNPDIAIINDGSLTPKDIVDKILKYSCK